MYRPLLIALACLPMLACDPGPQLESDSQALRERSGGGAGKKTRTQTSPTFTARTTDGHVNGVEPTWANVFPIDATYNVYFAAEISGSFGGHHTATFELRMPNGTVYQRIEAPFATDAVAYPGEQQAETFSSGWRVWTDIPVAGTVIEQYAMTGAWRVEIFVDGSATPTAAASFTLQ